MMTASLDAANATVLSPDTGTVTQSLEKASLNTDGSKPSTAAATDTSSSPQNDVEPTELIPLTTKRGDYNLPKSYMPPQSELRPIETFVMNALQSQHSDAPDPAHVQGYRAILDALRRPVDPPMLRMVLIALRTAGNGTAVTMITNHPTVYAQLVHFLFRLDSTKRPKIPSQSETEEEEFDKLCAVYDDGSLLEAHLHLVLNLVSARTVHLIPALTAIWKILCGNLFMAEDLQHRIHSMLNTMLRLVPKARSDMFPIIAARFPYWKSYKHSLEWHCMQTFIVLDYLPSMRKQVLEMIVDKCLEIDVNINIQDNGEAAVEKEPQKENDDQQNQAAKEEADKMVAKDSAEAVDELSDTLDRLLALLMGYLRDSSNSGLSARELYYEILPVFESTIITSHKSKFVQFCVFYLCGMESEQLATGSHADHDDGHPILYRDFASKLLELVMDPYRATLTRQSAACYLASFVSRASYVEAETVCESISALLRWAETYIDALAECAVRAADAREQSELHSLFYTVCQAAFYIMCFRGSDAVEFYKESLKQCNEFEFDGQDEVVLPHPDEINLGSARWTFVCNHELQPLRFCLESVRSEFLHVAHFFELIDQPILDKLIADAKRMSTGRVNKKAASSIKTAATLEKQRRKGGVGGLGRGSNPLKSFFPFDPLLLRRSHGFIEQFYKHWQGPVEEDDTLIIDEVPDDEEQPFDMDDASDQDETESSEDDEDGDDDDNPVVVSDQDEAEGSDSDSDDDRPKMDPVSVKQQQKEKWATTLKRPRSQSMENGSW
mmetsp:Transcript_40534/g.116519  ORF Transcript_40534/g.116519 Transcript_40534/m.116519 type:complete len:781 (-) Transcript_40534:774-3116(-)